VHPVEDAAARPLGMNDISMLLPLPRDLGAPVIAALGGQGEEQIDRRWFDALVTARGDIAPRTGGPVAFEDFHVVGVRFDLCDRSAIGPCPPGVAGRVRTVLQPLYVRSGAMFAHDVALHAFYPVPAGELGEVVAELRRLSRIQRAAPGAALSVSPAAAAGDRAYLDGLRALVLRYARAEQLVRLTVIGQVADSAAFAWVFRVSTAMVTASSRWRFRASRHRSRRCSSPAATRCPERADGGCAVGVRAGDQRAAVRGGERRRARGGGRSADRAAEPDAARHRRHPVHRLSPVGVSARAPCAHQPDRPPLPGWFASPLARATRTIVRDDPRVVRAFGRAGNAPAISLRVANDTAQVLADIEARFPAR
jgi:hypothetical protein